MARTPALSNGPVEFTDSKGKQISIPLSSIFFDGGAIQAEGAIYTANKTAVDAWLAYLAKTGEIVPDADPATKTVMVITAKDAGSNGDLIQLQFSNFDNTNPADPKFDTTVTETDTSAGLTPATVQAVLGSAAGSGSKPGLVFVPGAAPTDLPKAGTYALAGDPATVAIPKNTGAGNAFSVQAKASGADGEQTKVTIKDVDATGGTFTLVAAWQKSAAQITASQVGTSFAYEIQVSAPPGGTIAAPAAGTITLSGGSDVASASKASAVVPG